MYVPQLNNQRQVPVRLSSVNFEGVFTSSRLNMETLISQNLYNNNNNNAQTSNVAPQIPSQPTRPNIPMPAPNNATNNKATPQNPKDKGSSQPPNKK